MTATGSKPSTARPTPAPAAAATAPVGVARARRRTRPRRRRRPGRPGRRAGAPEGPAIARAPAEGRRGRCGPGPRRARGDPRLRTVTAALTAPPTSWSPWPWSSPWPWWPAGWPSPPAAGAVVVRHPHRRSRRPVAGWPWPTPAAGPARTGGPEAAPAVEPAASARGRAVRRARLLPGPAGQGPRSAVRLHRGRPVQGGSTRPPGTTSKRRSSGPTSASGPPTRSSTTCGPECESGEIGVPTPWSTP